MKNNISKEALDAMSKTILLTKFIPIRVSQNKEFNTIVDKLIKEDGGYESLLASVALLFEGKSYEYIIQTLKRIKKDFKKSMKKNKL